MRDIQPILNRKCIGCHNSNDGNVQTDTPLPNFADIEPMTYKYAPKHNKGIADSGSGAFSRSYHDLNPYVRRPGSESDNHIFNA
ncbi:hypothetical protein P6709_19905, partial [Jeotgalibacillus sp. ET6]|uniref:hypothetical protein n=1 Tax=Jeotgalibacillus sp. ET6 TaxID=3037260 RepID=UPI002418B6A4